VVKFAATTRSPIALGHDVRTAFRFADQYGLGMINFIYNVDPCAYDRVIWVIETATDSVDPAWWTWIPQLEVISLSEQEAVCSH
jgi:hypothetical protein